MSLHAATDELRERLVPLNRTYALDDVFAACARYVRRTHRKVLFEYVVLRGVNDTRRTGAGAAGAVRPPHYHLNLIAFNETGDGFVRPQARDLAALCAQLQQAGVLCTVRRSPGREHRSRLRATGAAARSAGGLRLKQQGRPSANG